MIETIDFVASNCDDGFPLSRQPMDKEEQHRRPSGVDGLGHKSRTPITRNSYIPKAPTNLPITDHKETILNP